MDTLTHQDIIAFGVGVLGLVCLVCINWQYGKDSHVTNYKETVVKRTKREQQNKDAELKRNAKDHYTN